MNSRKGKELLSKLTGRSGKARREEEELEASIEAVLAGQENEPAVYANVLYVRSDLPSGVDKFREDFKDKNEPALPGEYLDRMRTILGIERLTFGNLVPIPKKMLPPSVTEYGADFYPTDFVAAVFGERVGLSSAEKDAADPAKAALREWLTNNWGCAEDIGSLYAESIGDGSVTYKFSTTGGTPTRWLEAAAEKYPNLQFVHKSGECNPAATPYWKPEFCDLVSAKITHYKEGLLVMNKNIEEEEYKEKSLEELIGYKFEKSPVVKIPQSVVERCEF